MNWEGYKVLTLVDEPPRPEDIIMSQSRMTNMMRSPVREGLEREHGHPLPSPAMWWGTVMHSTIDMWIENRFAFDNPGKAMMDWVLELAADPPHPDDNGFSAFDVFTHAELARLCDEVFDAFEAWLAYWWEPEGQHLDIINREQRMTRQLGTLPDGRRVFVAGTPDLVAYKFGVPTGFDWKSKNGDPSLPDYASSPQAPILTWLLYPLVHTYDMVWEFVVYNKRKGEWTTWALDDEYQVHEAYVEATVANAWQWARAIAFEVYPAITMQTAGFVRSVRPWYAKPEFDPHFEHNPFRFYLDNIEED